MKKTRLLLLAMMAFVIAFSSCSKDDDFSIVGAWEQESLQLFVKPGPNLPELLLYEEQGEGITVTFNEDGTGTFTDDEEIDPFNWELSNNILTISYSEISMNFTLGTKTKSKVTGEQSMTTEELTGLLAMFDTEDLDLIGIIEQFPNATATLKIVFVR